MDSLWETFPCQQLASGESASFVDEDFLRLADVVRYGRKTMRQREVVAPDSHWHGEIGEYVARRLTIPEATR